MKTKTLKEIDREVYFLAGGWRKRRNKRNLIILKQNNFLDFKISELRREVRRLKSEGVRESALRGIYCHITKLEIMKI